MITLPIRVIRVIRFIRVIRGRKNLSDTPPYNSFIFFNLPKHKFRFRALNFCQDFDSI